MLGFSALWFVSHSPFGSADIPVSDGNALSTAKTNTLSAPRPWISWTSCCDTTTSHGSLQERPWSTPISVSPTVWSTEPVQARRADYTRQRRIYDVKKALGLQSYRTVGQLESQFCLVCGSYFTQDKPWFLELRTVIATLLQNYRKDSCVTEHLIRDHC